MTTQQKIENLLARKAQLKDYYYTLSDPLDKQGVNAELLATDRQIEELKNSETQA